MHDQHQPAAHLPPTSPCGMWPSPISPRTIASGLRLSDVQWDSDGRTLVWLEGRSKQGVLVCASLNSNDAPRDLTTDLSVRARVGYGGGDFTVSHGAVYFAASGCIYRQSLHHYGAPRPITPAFGDAASPTVSPDGKWLAFVHSYEGKDCIAIVDTDGVYWPQRLTSGHDFYMQPRWHPDGTQLAYIAWDHPLMPWDGTLLYLATVEQPNDGGLPTLAEQHVVVGDAETSIFQPEFSPDGQWLSYVSDESGWWHIVIHHLHNGTRRTLTRDGGEHARAAWVQGMRTYGWSHDSTGIYFLHNEGGFGTLFRTDLTGEEHTPLSGLEGYTWFDQPAVCPTTDAVACTASSSTQPTRLIVWQPPKPTSQQRSATSAELTAARIIRRATSEHVDPAQLADAKPVSWSTETGEIIHGLLFIPPSLANGGTTTTLPPAIVKVHGGPTHQSLSSYQADVQFFTTRGYVMLLVNYRGSTGYGRRYMQLLREQWGVYDVEDTVSAAAYLKEHNIADSSKIVVMGGSAGGYTVLESLCHAPGVFCAGVCMYGVSDLLALLEDTHKFEERYLDSMIGPFPATHHRYRERSPVSHAHLLNDPIAIFQGDEDTAVPKSQSDMIVASLRKRGIPHEYHVYEGEGHGWKKQETIDAFYTAVDSFLRRYVILA